MEDKEWKAKKTEFLKVNFSDPVRSRENYMVNLRKIKRSKAFMKKRPIINIPSISDAYETDASGISDYTPWNPKTESGLEDLINVLKNTKDKGYCFEVCHDQELLLFMSQSLDDYVNSSSIVGTQKKEEIICITLKILMDATSLEGYKDSRFVEFSYKNCKFGGLLRKLVIQCCQNISKLGQDICNPVNSDDIYMYLGFTQRSISILRNYLWSDSHHFYGDITDTKMHESFYGLFLTFYSYGENLSNDFIGDTYEFYADAIFCINSLILSSPFDVMEMSLDSIEMILKSIYPFGSYSKIKTTEERYQKIVSFGGAAIASICSTQEDGLAKFCDEISKIKQIVEITEEGLQDSTHDNKLALSSISKLIKSISTKSYDQKCEDAKLYPCLFKLIFNGESKIVEENITQAISQFIGHSTNILKDLADADTVGKLGSIALESSDAVRNNVASIINELLVYKKLNALVPESKISMISKYILSEEKGVKAIQKLVFDILENQTIFPEAEDHAIDIIGFLLLSKLPDQEEVLHRLAAVGTVNKDAKERILTIHDDYEDELSDYKTSY